MDNGKKKMYYNKNMSYNNKNTEKKEDKKKSCDLNYRKLTNCLKDTDFFVAHVQSQI